MIKKTFLDILEQFKQNLLSSSIIIENPGDMIKHHKRISDKHLMVK